MFQEISINSKGRPFINGRTLDMNMIAEIKFDYQNGISINEISKKHRISYPCAKKWAVANEVILSA